MRRAYPATYLLVGLNVAVFLAGYIFGQDRLYVAGAMYGPNVAHGEWYRLITSGFLHGGFAHVFVNMLSLYFLGTFCESVAGSLRMLVIYCISLLGSAIAIYYFAYMQPTVGASGAIFGLFGAVFAIGLKLGKPGRQLIQQSIGILVLNLVFTFSIPGLSIAGHIGGLLVGFIVGLLIYYPPKPVYARVVDANTGETFDSRVEAP